MSYRRANLSSGGRFRNACQLVPGCAEWSGAFQVQAVPRGACGEEPDLAGQQQTWQGRVVSGEEQHVGFTRRFWMVFRAKRGREA